MPAIAPADTPRTLGSVTKVDGSFSTTSSMADVPGLTGLTVACPSVVVVEFNFSKLSNDVSGGIAGFEVHMDGVAILAPFAVINPQTMLNTFMRKVLTGLTPGSSHTFKARVGRTIFGSTGNVILETGDNFPAILSVSRD